jgi:hypothetical protein
MQTGRKIFYEFDKIRDKFNFGFNVESGSVVMILYAI